LNIFPNNLNALFIIGPETAGVQRDDVKHWNGASLSTGLKQLYITPNTEKGNVEWMEPLTDSISNAD
jgi:hypothetical protein